MVSIKELFLRFLEKHSGGLHRGGMGDGIERKLERLLHEVEFVKLRLGAYLGEGVALTFLADETPILVNANDFGGPMNLLVGGIYESENLKILFSYLRPDSLVLDIGANLGYFSLMLAKRLRSPGHVHAFEPHPFLQELARRTMYMNGMRNLVTIHGFGLSDRDGQVEFVYPRGHLGGGRIGRVGKQTQGVDSSVPAKREGTSSIQSEIRVLDSVFPQGTSVDLVKIDVEGHELRVLKGMKRIIAESPSIAVLLEKLAPNGRNDIELYRYLASFGLELFGVDVGATLRPLSEIALQQWHGYVLAIRPQVCGSLKRNFFAIYPGQLRIPIEPTAVNEGPVAIVAGSVDELLFFGPYWYLERGEWSIRLEATLEGQLDIGIAGLHGSVLQRLTFRPGAMERRFAVDHAVVHFECIARAKSRYVRIELERIVFTKLG